MKVLEHLRFRACIAALELVNTTMKLSKEGKGRKEEFGALSAVLLADSIVAFATGATDWVAPTGGMILADRVNDVLDEVWGTNIRIGTEEEVYNAENWKK